MRIVLADCRKTITLGRRGEKFATEVHFDVTGFVQNHGDGRAELVIKRSALDAPVPVPIERDGNIVKWPVSDYDTAMMGYGVAELRWIVNDTLAKSAMFKTYVGDSVTVDPNTPEPAWVEKVMQLANEAKASAESSAASAVLAESWAVGGTSTRPGEDENNAEYWAEQARKFSAQNGGIGFYAVCHDEAASPTAEPNTWYVPKTSPRPSGDPGMMIDVMWEHGRTDGLGYDVSLIWGEPGGADNETIVGPISSTDSLTGAHSIPTEGTVRYQLEETNGRKHWRYVSGTLISAEFSTDTNPNISDKIVPGLSLGYLPGMEIYVQMDKGNTADVMRLVPDDGETLPVYGNSTGNKTGDIPAGYILHLKNAGDHWQIINGGATLADLDRPVHATMNVEIEDDGFGGYRTVNYNDNDINNHRNAGGIVQAKYTAPGGQTYTYYYSTMESDRKPTFIRTYIDENGDTVQVLASVGNDKTVTVQRRNPKTSESITHLNEENAARVAEINQLSAQKADKEGKWELIDTVDFNIAAPLSKTAEPDGTPYRFYKVGLRVEYGKSDGLEGTIEASTTTDEKVLNVYYNNNSHGGKKQYIMVYSENGVASVLCSNPLTNVRNIIALNGQWYDKQFVQTFITPINRVYTPRSIMAGTKIEIWAVREKEMV